MENNPKKIQIKKLCASFNNDPNELINILHKVQNTFGFIPIEIQKIIATTLELPLSKINDTVDHYSYFSAVPKGKYPITICIETECLEKGAKQILDEFKTQLNIEIGETTEDGKFSLCTLKCIGACGLAPVIMVGDKTYGRVKINEVQSIIKEYL